jgi:hypothetical protein
LTALVAFSVGAQLAAAMALLALSLRLARSRT